MPKRDSSPEPSSLPTSITGFETAIKYVEMKRRQPLDMLMPWEREGLFLTEKALGYELELQRIRAKIDKMRSGSNRLEALQDLKSELRVSGLRSKVDQAESLQEHVKLLEETCRKLKKETAVLKENVAVLGRMAKLMWSMTMTMVRYSYQESGINNEDEIELLTDNLETLGDVADLMFDMSQLMANISVQE